jgi:hypothetical protein
MGNGTSERKTGVLVSAQDWTKKRVLDPIEEGIKVLTGQAAHDEIKKYILENEAISDALYTRLLEVETQIRRLRSWIRGLTAAVAILAVMEVLLWVVR